MRVVWFGGGLGNQMFQYGLYCFLKKNNKEVKADCTQYSTTPMHNGFELERLFNLDIAHANLDVISKLTGGNRLSPRKVIWKIFRKRNVYFEEKVPFSFDPDVLKGNNRYLKGYWQNTNYLEPCEEELRDVFTFPAFSSDNNKRLAHEIAKVESVSVHFRRGDFLKSSNLGLFGGICSDQYYLRAIQTMENTFVEPVFYVFCDDPQWAKDTFTDARFTVIDWNIGSRSYRDMQLMSLCKHNIIANSTFSWWAAWLNRNPNRTVVAPERMVNRDLDFSGIFPNDWIRLRG